jgi:hypothetical protein
VGDFIEKKLLESKPVSIRNIYDDTPVFIDQPRSKSKR